MRRSINDKLTDMEKTKIVTIYILREKYTKYTLEKVLKDIAIRFIF